MGYGFGDLTSHPRHRRALATGRQSVGERKVDLKNLGWWCWCRLNRSSGQKEAIGPWRCKCCCNCRQACNSLKEEMKSRCTRSWRTSARMCSMRSVGWRIPSSSKKSESSIRLSSTTVNCAVKNVERSGTARKRIARTDSVAHPYFSGWERYWVEKNLK